MLHKQARGTSRKHVTKPFTQPAAPDCTSLGQKKVSLFLSLTCRSEIWRWGMPPRARSTWSFPVSCRRASRDLWGTRRGRASTGHPAGWWSSYYSGRRLEWQRLLWQSVTVTVGSSDSRLQWQSVTMTVGYSNSRLKWQFWQSPIVTLLPIPWTENIKTIDSS